ncbi:mechanosensitive ion channel family protein [Flavicella sediminum]|uniref:mechanosensitive ion channel family protein n=1 Tax=Flavicella sediminum TaxID=2585141 RepID=UPI00111F008B|nr:mechanosensitive ion channel domain-containing protein [Flavicella sediminum]
MEDFNKLFSNSTYDKIKELSMEYGLSLIQGILILLIGLWIIKKLITVVKNIMSKSKLEVSLQVFFSDLLNWVLKALLIITVLGQLGIANTSFVAIIGAAGLAVGLALQGTLSNFAGGALIMIFKPFKVGDLIEAQGELGNVKEIQIFVTKLVTPANKLAIIPNGILSNGTIKNYTEEGQLRVDLTIGISYDSDIKLAKEILEKTLNENPKVLKTPAAAVTVSELADSSVNLAVRPWASPENYWDVYFESLEACKLALDKANIVIPFPQRDVHMK